MTFTASHSATHFGDVVDFSCTVEGYPTNLSSITNNYGVNIHGQVHKTIGSFRTETLVVVQDVEEEDYVCSVEIHHKGSLVAEEKRRLKVKLYSKSSTTCNDFAGGGGSQPPPPPPPPLPFVLLRIVIAVATVHVVTG